MKNFIRIFLSLLLLVSFQNTGFAAREYNYKLKKRILNVVRNQHNLDKITLKYRYKEIKGQAKEFPGKVSFTKALNNALVSFLNDDDDIESPLSLMEGVDIPEGKTAQSFLREMMNRKDTILSIVDLKGNVYRPENGEDLDHNWIFYLTIPSLSDHLFWAVIDRQTGKTYNYGFN